MDKGGTMKRHVGMSIVTLIVLMCKLFVLILLYEFFFSLRASSCDRMMPNVQQSWSIEKQVFAYDIRTCSNKLLGPFCILPTHPLAHSLIFLCSYSYSWSTSSIPIYSFMDSDRKWRPANYTNIYFGADETRFVLREKTDERIRTTHLFPRISKIRIDPHKRWTFYSDHGSLSLYLRLEESELLQQLAPFVKQACGSNFE